MTAGPTEDTLGPLLNVLAQSLDVREVFNQISAVARQAVPHDRLMFGLITPDGEHYRVIASSETESQAVLAEVPLSALSQRLLKEDFAIFHHVRTVPGKTWGCAGQMRTASNSADQPFEWHPNLPWARGYESWMRLTVRLRGGGLGALDPPRVAPRGGPVRRAELRRAARGAARVGAVRLREGRLHRGGVGAGGTAGAGRGRDVVSRRSRRDEPRRAGEVPAGAAGAGLSAPRWDPDAQGRRARHCRDESRPEGRDDQGGVPRGSVLPAARGPDPPAAAAGAPGGHLAAARALRAGARAGGARAAGRGDLARGARPFPGLRLAGERARAAQRGGAGADSL